MESINGKKTLKYRMYHIVSSESEEEGLLNRVFSLFLMLLIISNVFAILLESVGPIHLAHGAFFHNFELFSIIVFSTEYIIRLWVCTEDPQYASLVRGRLKYVRSTMAIIDLLAILPFYLPFIIAVDLRFLRMLRLFRLFRLFKLARYSAALSLIKRAFLRDKEVLISAFIILLILLIMSSSVMYTVEYDAQPGVFDSIPSTMWWAIATLTTVGYGDLYPITPMGKFLGSFIAILGIAMFAIPTGVLATAFLEEMQKKKQEDEQENHTHSPEDIINLLERLDELRIKGVITEAEFESEKNYIMKLIPL